MTTTAPDDFFEGDRFLGRAPRRGDAASRPAPQGHEDPVREPPARDVFDRARVRGERGRRRSRRCSTTPSRTSGPSESPGTRSRKFGPEVLRIVEACTDADDGPEAGLASSKGVLHRPPRDRGCVRSCSFRPRTSCTTRGRSSGDLRSEGLKVWKRFNPESDQLWYYRALVEAFRREPGARTRTSSTSWIGPSPRWNGSAAPDGHEGGSRRAAGRRSPSRGRRARGRGAAERPVAAARAGRAQEGRGGRRHRRPGARHPRARGQGRRGPTRWRGTWWVGPHRARASRRSSRRRTIDTRCSASSTSCRSGRPGPKPIAGRGVAFPDVDLDTMRGRLGLARARCRAGAHRRPVDVRRRRGRAGRARGVRRSGVRAVEAPAGTHRRRAGGHRRLLVATLVEPFEITLDAAPRDRRWRGRGRRSSPTAQYQLLNMLRGVRRAAIVGGAGTGKTMLAAEKARRLAREGFTTLLVCFNAPLARMLGRGDRGRGRGHRSARPSPPSTSCARTSVGRPGCSGSGQTPFRSRGGTRPCRTRWSRPGSGSVRGTTPSSSTRGRTSRRTGCWRSRRCRSVAARTCCTCSTTRPRRSTARTWSAQLGLQEYVARPELPERAADPRRRARFAGEGLDEIALRDDGRPPELIEADGDAATLEALRKVLHRLRVEEDVPPWQIAVLTGVRLEESAVWRQRRFGNEVLDNPAVDDAGEAPRRRRRRDARARRATRSCATRSAGSRASSGRSSSSSSCVPTTSRSSTGCSTSVRRGRGSTWSSSARRPCWTACDERVPTAAGPSSDRCPPMRRQRIAGSPSRSIHSNVARPSGPANDHVISNRPWPRRSA